MIKYKGKDGKIKYIQLDNSEGPIEARMISNDILRILGLTIKDIEDDEEEKEEKIQLNGLSQNDIKFLESE